ncbi:hypothetical protein [Persephonella sp.]|uniref:hypothetical protein n=1 Tax=Persephonella sp. TaxID=2060922 RepID=UPI0026138C0E|nr:hypothetical protein [Persephonella sp.]
MKTITQTKAPDRLVLQVINRNQSLFLFHRIDKITACWVGLSCLNGGIEIAQPCKVLKK